MTETERLQSEIELAQLEQKLGHYPQPEEVEEFAAKHPLSALHKRFEWNDKIAGYSFRLEQARQILRVWVRVSDDNGTPKEMRASVSIAAPTPENPQAREYVSTQAVLNNEETRRQLIYNTLKRINGILASYPIDELAPLAKQVDRLLASYAPEPTPQPPQKSRQPERVGA